MTRGAWWAVGIAVVVVACGSASSSDGGAKRRTARAATATALRAMPVARRALRTRAAATRRLAPATAESAHAAALVAPAASRQYRRSRQHRGQCRNGWSRRQRRKRGQRRRGCGRRHRLRRRLDRSELQRVRGVREPKRRRVRGVDAVQHVLEQRHRRKERIRGRNFQRWSDRYSRHGIHKQLGSDRWCPLCEQRERARSRVHLQRNQAFGGSAIDAAQNLVLRSSTISMATRT